MGHWKETLEFYSLKQMSTPNPTMCFPQYAIFEVGLVLCILLICRNCSACISTDEMKTYCLEEDEYILSKKERSLMN